MSDFKQDPELRERVARWHIADIDEAIDALGDKASWYSRLLDENVKCVIARMVSYTTFQKV